MSKNGQSVNWGTVAKAKSNSSGGGIDFKALFLRPEAPKSEDDKNTYVVRFLENPYPYLVHWNRRTVNGKPKKVDFFDSSDDYRKINRNCFGTIDAEGEQVGTEDCIWCKQGYHKQLRYMVNVIDYTDKKDPRVRILDVPRSVLEGVSNWVQSVYEQEEEYIDPSAWDKDAPQFMITVERISSGGGVKYDVNASPKMRPLTDEELNMIRDLNPNANTDDEALKLHDVERWIAPTKPRTDLHGNPIEDDDTPSGKKKSSYIDDEEEDEDDDEALVKPASRSKQSKPDEEDEEDEDGEEKEDDWF